MSAADFVLVAHAAFIAFVVGGQALILAGWLGGWHWPRHLPFRVLHLAAIATVVLESWCGITCPLTWLEFELRGGVANPAAADGFIALWLHRLIFYDAPSWVFTLVYTLFGATVVAAFVFYPPRKRPEGNPPVIGKWISAMDSRRRGNDGDHT